MSEDEVPYTFDPRECVHEWTYVDIHDFTGWTDRWEFCAWCGKGRNDG